MTNAQHLIENAICCLERNETVETFMNRETNNEANISRDAVYSAETVLEMMWEAAQFAYHDYRLWLRNEFEPVKHGHWIISSDGYYPYCSVCKAEPESGKMTKWCPNCGAKMDEEDNS